MSDSTSSCKAFHCRQDVVNSHDPILLNIYDEMCRVSGNHPDHTHQPHFPYGTFHHPKFTFLSPNVRNTLVRFQELGIPDRLDGMVFFDIGCNLGHLSVELARRGAMVKSFDCVRERLDIFQKLVNHLGLQESIHIHYTDFNHLNPEDFLRIFGVPDHVICLAVDGYIRDLGMFYKLLSSLTMGYCYLESNNKIGIPETQKKLASVFHHVKELGHSSAYGGPRTLFRLRNMKKISSRNTTHPKQTYLRPDGTRIHVFRYNIDFALLKRLEQLHHPHIPPLRAQYRALLCPYYPDATVLNSVNIHPVYSMEDKARMKAQIIDVVKYLATMKIAHRDFLAQNILWLPDKKEIRVIDWEFAVEDTEPEITKRYDLIRRDYTREKNTISTPQGCLMVNSVFSCPVPSVTLDAFFSGNLSLNDFR